MRAPGALRVPGHPQHPPVLRHQEGREEEAEAHGQQSQGRAGRAREEVNTNILIMMNISNDQWKSGQQATERRVQHDHDADRGHCGVLVGGDAAHGHHCATHHLLKVGETQNLKIRNLSELLSSVTDFLDYDLAKRLVFIINLCIYLSYPLNFAIYCGMSRRVEIIAIL